ncbi:MAG: radical SAM protein [Defluviitaleaceae bacterium]|nr:radical SAM protein [Defluviitaleaceae bacterium]
MVFSKFNEAFHINGCTVVYNHLSKCIVRFENAGFDLFDTLDNSKFKQNDINELQKRGLIVDDNIDEDLLAGLAFNDYIYDKTLRLVLLPAESCNFRCKFCYELFSESNPFMSIEIVNSLLKFLRKNITKFSSLSIDWFGGEPLLASGIISEFSQKAKDICVAAKIPYRAMMTTNAYLLDVEMLESMLRYNITSFHVTLCGLQETHDSLRPLADGSGTFEKIINNLTNIRDSVKRKSFKIMLRINVTKSVLENLKQFILFLDGLFGRDERFTVYFRPVGDWGGEQVSSIIGDLNVTKKDIFNKVLSTETTLNFDAYYSLLNSSICAASLRNSYVIRANGDINKCTESLYTDYNYVGKIIPTGDMNINKYNLARWLYLETVGVNCKECIKHKICKNRKCPDNILKPNKNLDSYCGYDEMALFEVLSVLCISKSKHILPVTVKQ